MSVPKSAAPAQREPVLAAFDMAPLDPDALTPDEAAALDAQITAAEEQIANGEGAFRIGADVTAGITARANREG